MSPAVGLAILAFGALCWAAGYYSAHYPARPERLPSDMVRRFVALGDEQERAAAAAAEKRWKK